MKTTIIGLTVLALSTSGAVLAGEHKASMGAEGQTSFNQLDKDGDGYVTQSEAQGHEKLSGNWSQADADRDGQISESEFSAFEAMETESGSEME